MVKIIKHFFYLLWRIWFYVLVAVPIIVLFPVLLVLSSREQWYPYFFWLARNIWANSIIYGMGFWARIENEERMEKGKSYVLIANHTSMLDIMLMLKVSKNPFVFVGKKELAGIPIFGFFYKRVCILVDRNNTKSRSVVYTEAQQRLDKGMNICIFPEGGVPDDESIVLDEFKDGAFRLAIQYQIPIVPMVFYDNKKRFSFTFFSGSLGKIRAKVFKFIPTKGLTLKDKQPLKNTCRGLMYNNLVAYLKNYE